MDIPAIIRDLLISVPPILVAITFHEAAHGLVAYRLGDPTAKMMGRLTLNPIRHIDPIGTVLLPIALYLMAGFVIGYAKPVPINPLNFKNPKRDMAISAAGGPLTNVILAFLSILLIRLVVAPLAGVLPEAAVASVLRPVYLMLKVSAIINVVLAVFNMIPIPPLDGGRVAVGVLPRKEALALSRVEPFGFMIVIVLFFVLGMGRFLFGPVINCVLKLTG